MVEWSRQALQHGKSVQRKARVALELAVRRFALAEYAGSQRGLDAHWATGSPPVAVPQDEARAIPALVARLEALATECLRAKRLIREGHPQAAALMGPRPPSRPPPLHLLASRSGDNVQEARAASPAPWSPWNARRRESAGERELLTTRHSVGEVIADDRLIGPRRISGDGGTGATRVRVQLEAPERREEQPAPTSTRSQNTRTLQSPPRSSSDRGPGDVVVTVRSRPEGERAPRDPSAPWHGAIPVHLQGLGINPIRTFIEMGATLGDLEREFSARTGLQAGDFTFTLMAGGEPRQLTYQSTLVRMGVDRHSVIEVAMRLRGRGGAGRGNGSRGTNPNTGDRAYVFVTSSGEEQAGVEPGSRVRSAMAQMTIPVFRVHPKGVDAAGSYGWKVLTTAAGATSLLNRREDHMMVESNIKISWSEWWIGGSPSQASTESASATSDPDPSVASDGIEDPPEVPAETTREAQSAGGGQTSEAMEPKTVSNDRTVRLMCLDLVTAIEEIEEDVGRLKRYARDIFIYLQCSEAVKSMGGEEPIVSPPTAEQKVRLMLKGARERHAKAYAEDAVDSPESRDGESKTTASSNQTPGSSNATVTASSSGDPSQSPATSNLSVSTGPNALENRLISLSSLISQVPGPVTSTASAMETPTKHPALAALERVKAEAAADKEKSLKLATLFAKEREALIMEAKRERVRMGKGYTEGPPRKSAGTRPECSGCESPFCACGFGFLAVEPGETYLQLPSWIVNKYKRRDWQRNLNNPGGLHEAFSNIFRKHGFAGEFGYQLGIFGIVKKPEEDATSLFKPGMSLGEYFAKTDDAKKPFPDIGTKSSSSSSGKSASEVLLEMFGTPKAPVGNSKSIAPVAPKTLMFDSDSDEADPPPENAEVLDEHWAQSETSAALSELKGFSLSKISTKSKEKKVRINPDAEYNTNMDADNGGYEEDWEGDHDDGGASGTATVTFTGPSVTVSVSGHHSVSWADTTDEEEQYDEEQNAEEWESQSNEILAIQDRQRDQHGSDVSNNGSADEGPDDGDEVPADGDTQCPSDEEDVGDSDEDDWEEGSELDGAQ